MATDWEDVTSHINDVEAFLGAQIQTLKEEKGPSHSFALGCHSVAIVIVLRVVVAHLFPETTLRKVVEKAILTKVNSSELPQDIKDEIKAALETLLSLEGIRES